MDFTETDRNDAGKSLYLTGKLWKSVELGSSTSNGISPDFLDRFPPEKHKKLIRSHRNNPETFRFEYCFQVPPISKAFLQERAPDLGTILVISRNSFVGVLLYFHDAKMQKKHKKPSKPTICLRRQKEPRGETICFNHKTLLNH